MDMRTKELGSVFTFCQSLNAVRLSDVGRPSSRSTLRRHICFARFHERSIQLWIATFNAAHCDAPAVGIEQRNPPHINQTIIHDASVLRLHAGVVRNSDRFVIEKILPLVRFMRDLRGEFE